MHRQTEGQKDRQKEGRKDGQTLFYRTFYSPKRRRKFVAVGLDIEHYRKKPKMLFSGMIQQSHVIGNETPTSLFSTKVSNFLWMAKRNLSDNVPT